MADAAQELQRLYTQRATVVTAGGVADAMAAKGDRAAVLEGERLFNEMKRIDQAIDRLENANGTIQ